ncbi:MAG: 4-hydroxybenzoate octaprenyltransferase, partial [Verrucomicrobiales bacterium]|nr:4-hydroxybenzoate octaprenyltransferase [Verrucomicrobiales bacterium]
GDRITVLAVLQKWADFVKISHTVFALPFALSAMLVAARDSHGWPGWKTLILILLAMVGARTSAMAFNRIVDRRFDAANPRTAKRHLATGEISLASAWTLWGLSALLLIGSSFFLNRLCFYLSPLALLIVCFYSVTKRFTDFTHVYLGFALSLAPLGAWMAVKGNFSIFPLIEGSRGLYPTFSHNSALLPICLAIAVVFWLIGFDIIYAIQDYDFDRKSGLHSLVVRWGIQNALQAAFLAHMLMCMVLFVFGYLAGFRLAYFVGEFMIAICLLFEHWLARRRSLDWVNNAFFRLNAVISLVFLAVTATEVVFPFFRVK